MSREILGGGERKSSQKALKVAALALAGAVSLGACEAGGVAGKYSAPEGATLVKCDEKEHAFKVRAGQTRHFSPQNGTSPGVEVSLSKAGVVSTPDDKNVFDGLRSMSLEAEVGDSSLEALVVREGKDPGSVAVKAVCYPAK